MCFSYKRSDQVIHSGFCYLRLPFLPFFLSTDYPCIVLLLLPHPLASPASSTAFPSPAGPPPPPARSCPRPPPLAAATLRTRGMFRKFIRLERDRQGGLLVSGINKEMHSRWGKMSKGYMDGCDIMSENDNESDGEWVWFWLWWVSVIVSKCDGVWLWVSLILIDCDGEWVWFWLSLMVRKKDADSLW